MPKKRNTPLCKCGCGLLTPMWKDKSGHGKNYLVYIPEHKPQIIQDGQKRCTQCRERKPVGEFYKQRGGTGLMGECRVCNKKRARQTKYRLHGSPTAYYRKKRYGVTQDDVDKLILSQNGVCAICTTRPPTCVDHCHNTNQVRGMLCQRCNSAIGVIGEIEGTKRMLAYLSL